MLPKIGITMGDPTGIGPEIIVKAFSKKELFEACRPVVLGDEGVLLGTIRMLNLPVTLETVQEVPEADYRPGKIFLLALSRLESGSILFGKPDQVCGTAMESYVEEAVRLIQQGKLDAMTTCPINKHAMNKAGHSFPGHTELLAHLTGGVKVAMMFIGSRWKIVLATIHLPLKEVANKITSDRIFSTLCLTEEGLKKYFGIPHPKIAVLGLNPHSGEEGLLGKEEMLEVLPALDRAKFLGMDVGGPFPADSFFNLSGCSDFDAVIAMYHDQGLIPMKMIDFKGAVNFTLGLPFIRTSVDHGTAYDIAGKGIADPANLVQAVLTAARLSQSTVQPVITPSSQPI